MNLKSLFFIFILAIFAISCNESIIESETLTPKTNELKAAVIGINYYVSPTGSNSNDGSVAHPFLTLAYTETNLQTCCGNCNFMKSNYALDVFLNK